MQKRNIALKFGLSVVFWLWLLGGWLSVYERIVLFFIVFWSTGVSILNFHIITQFYISFG